MVSEAFLFFILILAPCIETANRLNDYITHFEPLTYDSDELHRSHSRAKRSVVRNNHVHLSFQSHGRNFNMRLKRDLSVFAGNLVVEGLPQVDTSHVYTGHLIGEPRSHVFGSIIDGVFEGTIYTSDESFYVEKARHYFPADSLNNSFHSVIYRGIDVEDSKFGGCGVTDEIASWMNEIQNSAVEDDEDKESRVRRPSSNNVQLGRDLDFREIEQPFAKYSKEFNVGSRSKRAAIPKEENNNTCSLFIQTDPLIWRHIHEQVNFDPEKTREEILSLIAHHVTAVNYIYRDTKFDGRYEHRNIKFEVQRIKIDDDSPCKPNHVGEANHFCMENIDVSNFLNLHSLENHEHFCLAYVFTYRDFTGGTLGLAWVASASGASGGICERHKTYTETVGGMYHNTRRSLNTGIITFVNYNSRVPPKVSQLTLAHEIGHNFGSPHDFPLECRPGGQHGNFIMFASATSGDRPNNSKFSHCSVGNISNVLDSIEEGKKRSCFSASAGAFCGNKIVEEGEECDCGYDDDECADQCCYPRIVGERGQLLSNHSSGSLGCKRRQGTQCSPSEGPCCRSDTCTFVPAHYSMQCKTESDCSWSSMCNGTSAECPSPRPKENKTRCNEGTQLCINGDCTGSICLEWNLTECFLSSASQTAPGTSSAALGGVLDKRRLCELACQNGSDPATCRSTSEFAHLVGLPPGGISLRPGSPCDNFQGYCDVFLKCRAVDAEGPLARLKNLLLNRETLQSVSRWVTEYWWAVLLLGLVFIILMGIFIKCCAVHTPSSNPKKPPARRISETLRRPINTLRRMSHHPNHHHHQGPHRGGGGREGGGGGQHRGGRGPRGGTRPSGPAHGYGANRGQYYAPSAPASSSYSSAYSNNRNAFEMQRPSHQNKV